MDLYNFYELMTDEASDIMREYEQGATQMSWSVIPFPRLKKIWEDYARYRIVRDEKGMDRISQKMLKNLARLIASTDFAGHSMRSPAEMYNDHIDPEEPMTNNILFDDLRYGNFFDTQYGPAYSDYGLEPLSKIAVNLITTTNPEQQLQLVDQMLNVVHQRGDLAALFVEGGTDSLNTLAGY